MKLTHPKESAKALVAERLAKAIEGASVAHRTVERLGLQADLDEVERVLEDLGHHAGGLRLGQMVRDARWAPMYAAVGDVAKGTARGILCRHEARVVGRARTQHCTATTRSVDDELSLRTSQAERRGGDPHGQAMRRPWAVQDGEPTKWPCD